jgi:hypothetical protein
MRSLFVCLFALLLAAPAGAQSEKLTTVLAELARASAGRTTPLAVDAMPRAVRDAIQGRRLRIDADNNVQVYILLSSVTDETVRQLTDAGVTIEIRDERRRRVQAHLPVSRLDAVARLDIVDAIRLPTYARHHIGKVTSEGDSILFADAVRTQLALDGTGVRVGVISDGIKGVFATGCTTCAGVDGGPISTSDLPAASGVRNASGVLTSSVGGILGRSFQANGDLEGLPPATPACAFAGAGAEGTALLEIVHDLAPGAKLAFANGDTDLEFNQAVNFLAASNDVVLDDIGFYGEPYDGTSSVSRNTAAALNDPNNPIRAYFTSVGNAADEHYFGGYVNSGVDGSTISGIANPGRLHLFQRTADTTDLLGLGPQPYNVIALPANGEVVIFLTWNDPFGGSANNYDLYLVQQSTGRVVASSTDLQNGRQDPVEVIDYVNRTGGQDFFRIVVQNVRDAAQPRNLNLYSFEPECAASGPLLLAPPRHERHNYNTATRSVSAQADAGGSPVSVLSVGAICSASGNSVNGFPANAPSESCLDTTNRTAEFFSSRGPTIDGRTKPDISAIDGVQVSGAGSFPSTFFGTSAASPHMGGIAALLLQGAPCLMNRTASTVAAASARATLRDLLLGNAVRLTNDNPDNVFGAGRANAFAAANTILPSWGGRNSTLTFDANTTFGAALSPAQLGFVDPNSCSLTTLSWTGGCGTSPGTSMTCPAGTNTVSVAASNNGVGFGPPSDLQVLVTDYAIDVAPPSVTSVAGGTTTHTVTVTPVNGPYNSEITLSCASGNLPPQTTCAFDPPTVTPHNAPVRSTLKISTTARTSASTASTRTAAQAPKVVTPAAAGSGIAVLPTSLTFQSQTVSTTTPPQFVYVTNIGTGALAIVSITTSGDFSGVNNCGSSLAVGASCAVAVSFTPAAAGSRTGSLAILDDAPGSPHLVSLTGTGQAAPTSTTGTPAGAYTIGVSGTVGTLVHFAGVIVTVQ